MKVKTRQRLRKGLLLGSFLMFPITMYYFSPALIIQGAAAGIVTGSFIMFGLLFVSSLFVGRGFCGWVCPGAGLQEACMPARDKTLKPGKRDLIKYFIWVPWIAGIAAAAVAAGGLHSVDPFLQTKHGISISEPGSYVIYYGFIALIVALALSAGRRAFCRYVCWMAPFMVIGRRIRNLAKWPALRLVADPDSCRECKSCNRACPQSLDVRQLVSSGSMENDECILCGTCVDTCAQKTLRFSFSAGTGACVRAQDKEDPAESGLESRAEVELESEVA